MRGIRLARNSGSHVAIPAHAGFAALNDWIMRNVVGMKEIPERVLTSCCWIGSSSTQFAAWRWASSVNMSGALDESRRRPPYLIEASTEHAGLRSL